MADEQSNRNNQQIGKDLYKKDEGQWGQHGQRYGYRGQDTRQWGEGNYFHTGPNPRGAQDSNERKYGESYHHDRRSTYAQERNAHLGEHYGSKPGSAYREESHYLNHGNRRGEQHEMRRPQTPGGSLQRNYGDTNDYRNEPWREAPGSRSRYKDDDYRYGSGSHNWYREGRYTPDSDETAPYPRDHRGFMTRVKDTWNDIWHSDEPGYQRHHHQSGADRVDSHKRYGSEPYRDRSFDRGYEGGPRWADESDSGRDNYYNDTDRNQRYRR
ncbi:hypothetical protein [Pontibacter anaerobius]|uniref:SWFGD domain-containing protein n=1 Tax=Pontibacter anaerobius TaxID=2993940 RepID=A0ABT3RIS6_9BACT|nr:hypothetical protein [Pontibacter anaerobius]MCX2741268.1 hypothetical protein [Pontibacter anaerobius]